MRVSAAGRAPFVRAASGAARDAEGAAVRFLAGVASGVVVSVLAVSTLMRVSLAIDDALLDLRFDDGDEAGVTHD